MSIPTLTGFLFASTAYYFGREEALPQLANLVTFRAFAADAIGALPVHHSYLRWWRGLTQDRWLAVWLVALAALLSIAQMRRVAVVETCAYATALVVTGLLMMLLNSFLTELLPRYTLPMFQLTFLSLIMVVARISDSVTSGRHRTQQSS